MYKIAVIPGDGIGPEVIKEGLKVLKASLKKHKRKCKFEKFDLGAQRYLKTGECLPDSILKKLKTFDAIYFGAIGDPRVKPGILERDLLLKIRFELDLYINIRPTKLLPNVTSPLANKSPDDIDFVVIRENSEGIYTGVGGDFKKNTTNQLSMQIDINTYSGVERCIRFAYEYCKKRNKKNTLTLVDKANVLTYQGKLWQEIFYKIGKKYPQIKKDHCYVDACCMYIVQNPERFDVIVTNNLFGDIITDLSAGIAGGLGFAPSGNINPRKTSLFEPVHGSAPDIAGKNIANPIGAILTASLMMDYLGEKEVANTIENAVIKTLNTKKALNYKTTQWGDLIAKNI